MMESYCHFALGGGYTVAVFWHLRSAMDARLSYFSLTIALFLLANGVGLMFSPSIMIDLADYQMEACWLKTSGLAYLPILFGSVALVIALRLGERGAEGAGLAMQRRSELNGLGFWAVMIGLGFGSLIIVRYLFLEGWVRAVAWREIVDWESAYSTRYSFDRVEGRGAYSSALAAFCGVPICSAFLLQFGRLWSLVGRFALVSVPLALSLLRAASNLQRSAVILQCLIVGIVLLVPWLDRSGGQSVKWAKRNDLLKFVLWGGLIFFPLGLLVYSRSDDLTNPVVALLRRMIVVPSHTAAFYFGVFPEIEPYRGWTGMFSIPLGSWTDYKDEEVSLKMIGYYANGFPHNANVNFVVTAYSAAGWRAVLLVETGYLLFIWFVGRIVGKVGGVFPIVCFVLSFQGLFAVSQADLLGGVAIGFVWAQGLLLCLTVLGLRSEVPPIAEDGISVGEDRQIDLNRGPV